MIPQTLLVGTILGFSILFSGCGSSKELKPAMNTGFFKNYDALHSQVKPNLKKYTKIQIAPVRVISDITPDMQSPSQAKLYKDISEYLNKNYMKIISASENFKPTTKMDASTLILQSAVSTVEVHFDDKEWNQLTPITMGLDVVSFNAYMYEYVRVLGEMRLVDSKSGEVIARNLRILKEHPITIKGDDLDLSNLQGALDSWLKEVKINLAK